MKNAFLCILLIMICSCDEKLKENKNISETENPIKAINNNLDEKILNTGNKFQNYILEINSIEKVNTKELEIELFFTKKAIAINHQKIILEYLTSQINEFESFEKVNYKFGLTGEPNFNQLEFKKSDISNLRKEYESISYLNLMKFILTNFDVGTSTQLNIWIKNVNQVYPQDLINSDIFSLIKTFAKECNKEVKTKDAKATIVVMYVAIRKYLEDKNLTSEVISEQPKNMKILNSLWQICNQERIEFAEQRMFGDVGNNNYPKLN